MRLDHFFVLNRNTIESAPFTSSETCQYEGAYLLPGELHAHDVWLPAIKGHIRVPARRSCLVIAPKAIPEMVEAFVDLLGGLPLFAVESEGQVLAHQRGANIKAMPILNMRRLPGLSNAGDEHTVHMESAIHMLDAFRAFTRGEPLPQAIKDAQIRAQLLGAQAPEGPAFGGRQAFVGLGGSAATN